MKKYYQKNSKEKQKRYQEDGIHLKRIRNPKDRKLKVNVRNYTQYLEE